MSQTLNRVVLPLLAAAMGALGYYHVDRESQPAPLTAPPVAPVESPYGERIAAVGVVEARTENIAVGAALAGIVLEVYVPGESVGTRVSAGQPLFRVDDRHLQAQLEVAKAELALAEARLARLEQQPRPEELPPSLARVHAASADAARLSDLYERARRLIEKGVLTEEEFVTRRQAYEAASHEAARAQADHDLLRAGAWQPDLQIAQAAVNEARARVQQTQVEIARATVTSPVDGVILQVNVRPGERVSDQSTSPLMVLGDLASFHVRVDIDERDIARFRRGSPATAFPRGDTAQAIAMQFQRVEPFVVPKRTLTGENTERVDTRVLQVLYAIDSPDADVYVGQQLDVFIRADRGLTDPPSMPEWSQETEG